MEEQLSALSPLDGRYRKITEKLRDYFSEWALIRYRLRVEVEYFIALCEWPLPELAAFPRDGFARLRNLYREFNPTEAARIKSIEKITNHDVKAVEYYLKEFFAKQGWTDFQEFIHFGLTSQDVNNTAVPLSLKEALEEVYLPTLEELQKELREREESWGSVPMLARTHGQPASPTRMGKEIGVFRVRLEEQISSLLVVPHSAKFGGATGNYNAHHLAYPEIDWRAFGLQFTEERLGLKQAWPTTQIEHYDHLAALCDALRRINTLLIDLNRDFWTYISLDYFKQQVVAGEVGSSAMPHKVNPIDFENSEGNLGLANALFVHLAQKLPISRLQRDLTDSTVLRNVGVPLGHSLLAFRSLLKGLSKISLNQEQLNTDLEANWAVLAEAIQSVMRRYGYPKPYEKLKELTRTANRIDQRTLQAFIADLELPTEAKQRLLALSPQTYTGI